MEERAAVTAYLTSAYDGQIVKRKRSNRQLTLVDEVDGEDGLEQRLGRCLTLFENRDELRGALLSHQVSLGGRTTDNGNSGVWALGREAGADEIVEPSGCDCVGLECFSFKPTAASLAFLLA